MSSTLKAALQNVALLEEESVTNEVTQPNIMPPPLNLVFEPSSDTGLAEVAAFGDEAVSVFE